jgi:UDP-3-O-[3-hydroxymyristoyl] N-acetylglucosamine deacetylase
MDGSAEPFIFLIDCAGVVEQQAARQAIKILRRIAVGDEERGAVLSPATEPAFSFEIEFDSPAIRRQQRSLRLVNGAFKHELSRARTFGFMHEVEGLKKMGLALGGSLDNAVVVSGDRVLNDGGLRYSDEFVRHKILDSVGDLYLAGFPIIGHFHGSRSGHTHNNQVLRELFASPESWRLVDAGQLEAERLKGERIRA